MTTPQDCEGCARRAAEIMLLRTALMAIRSAVETALDSPPLELPARD